LANQRTHSIEFGALHQRRAVRYACALLIAALAVALRFSLNPVLGAYYAYTVFYPAVMIAATVCGLGPGLLSTAAMTMASVLWLLPPPFDRVDAVSLVLFVASAIIMCIVGGLYRRTRSADKLLKMFKEEATQRGRAEQTLQQTQNELTEDLDNTRRLHNLAVRYVSQENLNAVLDEILDAAIAVTHSKKGTLQLFDGRTGVLKIRAAKGFSTEWLDFFQTVDRQGATCAEALRTRERVIVPDVRLSTIFAGTPSLSIQLKEGVLAIQSTPLISRSGEFLGMISTHFSEPHTPKDRELHWMDLLARQAADLIEQSRAVEALRQSELLLRTVTREARVGLVIVDKDWRYTFANQTYLNLVGLEESEIIGKRIPDVQAGVYDQIKPNLSRAFQGERVSYEVKMPSRDHLRKERVLEIICEPHASDTGIPYVVVVTVDITERKKMQQVLEQTVEQRTAKLRETIHELETFSYSIVHDMRAPLRAMQGFSKVLLEEQGPQLDEEGRDHLRRIEVSARRLDALIQDVLDYSKIVRSELPLETIRTDEFLHEIIDSYPDLHLHRSQIHLQEPMPPVLANPAALTQVVSNLLGNAVKFVRPGIKPDVQVRAELLNKSLPQTGKQSPPVAPHAGTERDSRQVRSKVPPQNAKKRVVRLWFEDNGIGIRKELYDRIFLMFQRLNPAQDYEGTGMGLTIVRKAIERMGGAVGLESDPGKGSRFWIELQEA
jgi:PAS domain S-box-containing protein